MWKFALLLLGYYYLSPFLYESITYACLFAQAAINTIKVIIYRVATTTGSIQMFHYGASRVFEPV
jgi:hypothetical protein